MVIASRFSWRLLAHPVLYNTVELPLFYFVVTSGINGPADRTGRKRLVNRSVRWIRSYHGSFISPLKPVVTLYATSFNIEGSNALPTRCIYVFCTDLRTNSCYFLIHHWLIGFCNRDGECLLRGTDWVFIHRPLLRYNLWLFFYSRTMHLDIIKVFYLPTDAQENYFKRNIKIYVKNAPTCFCLTLRWLMSYIYGAPILDVSRSHTTTQHSR